MYWFCDLGFAPKEVQNRKIQ